MANYDLSIDQARAEKWKNDVDVEIERVQELLKKVAAIQMTIPGDDDPIMQGITNVCENLESFWTSMIKGFRRLLSFHFNNFSIAIRYIRAPPISYYKYNIPLYRKICNELSLLYCIFYSELL